MMIELKNPRFVIINPASLKRSSAQYLLEENQVRKIIEDALKNKSIIYDDLIVKRRK